MQTEPIIGADSASPDQLNQIQDILFGRQMRSLEQVIRAQAATINELHQQIALIQQQLSQDQSSQQRAQAALSIVEAQGKAAHKQLEQSVNSQLTNMAEEQRQLGANVAQEYVKTSDLSAVFYAIAESLRAKNS